MAIRVYVSTDPAVQFDGSWERVGTIETGDTTINEQAVKQLQKHRSGSATLSVHFYLAGDPAARWVQSSAEHARFGIAFDLIGDGSCVLVANRPGQVAPLGARPPEPHPGLRVRPVFLGIKIAGGVKRV